MFQLTLTVWMFMQVLRAQDFIASLSEVAVFPPCRLKELQTTLFNTSVAIPRNSYPIFVAKCHKHAWGLNVRTRQFNLQACGHPAYGYIKKKGKERKNRVCSCSLILSHAFTTGYLWLYIYIYITHVCGEKY